ncbi:MAG TPA: MFS transporter [Fimbriiglobus sp.]|jgi:MFS family permease
MHSSSDGTLSRTTRAPGANAALALLLSINLFNYIDRQVLSAVLPKLELDARLFSPTDHWLEFKLGLLTSAFLVSYTLLSPVFGWFGDRSRRWLVVGIGVTIWSLASGASGLATGYFMLLATRCLVGIGEAAYGPVAPSMLSDLYPIASRGKIMALFYMAIPVGSALGFVIGGLVEKHFGWRSAFLITLFGLIPATLCFFMREPARPGGVTKSAGPGYLAVMKELKSIRSFVLCCLGMTATTFMLGGVATWTPRYVFQREAKFEVTTAAFGKLEELRTTTGDPVVPPEVVDKLRSLDGTGEKGYAETKADLLAKLGEEDLKQYGGRIYEAATTADSITLVAVNFRFGMIVVIGGLSATLLGGWAGDWLRAKGVRGAYFHAAGWTTIVAWPFYAASLFVPFPYAWGMLFFAVFFLFFNTGPANTILANVTRPSIRATAFAINILIIHMFGDVISPPLIGLIAGFSDLHTAIFLVSLSIPVGGILWVLGAKHLDADTAKAESQAA